MARDPRLRPFRIALWAIYLTVVALAVGVTVRSVVRNLRGPPRPSVRAADPGRAPRLRHRAGGAPPRAERARLAARRTRGRRATRCCAGRRGRASGSSGSTTSPTAAGSTRTSRTRRASAGGRSWRAARDAVLRLHRAYAAQVNRFAQEEANLARGAAAALRRRRTSRWRVRPSRGSAPAHGTCGRGCGPQCSTPGTRRNTQRWTCVSKPARARRDCGDVRARSVEAVRDDELDDVQRCPARCTAQPCRRRRRRPSGAVLVRAERRSTAAEGRIRGASSRMTGGSGRRRRGRSDRRRWRSGSSDWSRCRSSRTSARRPCSMVFESKSAPRARTRARRRAVTAARCTTRITVARAGITVSTQDPRRRDRPRRIVRERLRDRAAGEGEREAARRRARLTARPPRRAAAARRAARPRASRGGGRWCAGRRRGPWRSWCGCRRSARAPR